jgi:hypothetical protein
MPHSVYVAAMGLLLRSPRVHVKSGIELTMQAVLEEYILPQRSSPLSYELDKLGSSNWLLSPFSPSGVHAVRLRSPDRE